MDEYESTKKAKPVIEWAKLPPIEYGTSLSDSHLNATATYDGEGIDCKLSYEPGPSTMLPAGKHRITVTCAPKDKRKYHEADATAEIEVYKATPKIVWSDPPPLAYGTPLGDAHLNAQAVHNGTPVPGTIVYEPPAGTVPPAGDCHVTAKFAPADGDNYESTTGTTQIPVCKGPVEIHWPVPASIVYGTPLDGTQLNATATSGGSPAKGHFVYDPPAGTILKAGAQQLKATFQPDDCNCDSGSATVCLEVCKATPVIDWPFPAPIEYGTPLSSVQLNAVARHMGQIVDGLYIYTPSFGTVLAAGQHILDVLFRPTDTANFNDATETVNLQVDKATPILYWAPPVDIVYGTPLGSAQLNAEAAHNGVLVPGSMQYSPAAGTILGAGRSTLAVSFTPADTRNYNSAAGYVDILVDPATPVIQWSPASIVYGTPLGSGQLNAVAQVNGNVVSGTYVYDPGAGAVLDAGEHTLKVAFTPDDAQNYTGASATGTLVVTRAQLRIYAHDQSRVVGDENPDLCGTIQGLYPGDSIEGVYSTRAAGSSPAGNYPITCKLSDPGKRLANYDVTCTHGNLTVYPPALGPVYKADCQPCRGELRVVLVCADQACLPRLNGVKIELNGANYIDNKTLHHGNEVSFGLVTPQAYRVLLAVPAAFDVLDQYDIVVGDTRESRNRDADGSCAVDVAVDKVTTLEIGVCPKLAQLRVYAYFDSEFGGQCEVAGTAGKALIQGAAITLRQGETRVCHTTCQDGFATFMVPPGPCVIEAARNVKICGCNYHLAYSAPVFVNLNAGQECCVLPVRYCRDWARITVSGCIVQRCQDGCEAVTPVDLDFVLYRDGDPEFLREESSIAAQCASFDGLIAGTYILTVTTPFVVVGGTTYELAWPCQGAVQVLVCSGQDVDLGPQFRFQPLARSRNDAELAGQITDASGAGVAFARIDLLQAGTDLVLWTSAADGNGHYAAPALPCDVDARIWDSKTGQNRFRVAAPVGREHAAKAGIKQYRH